MNTTEHHFLTTATIAARGADIFERKTMAKVTRRIVPFLAVCYSIAFLDRVNVGFANATMSKDVALSAAAFGGAAGIFFIGYFCFEVPSNLALNKYLVRAFGLLALCSRGASYQGPRPSRSARQASTSFGFYWALPRLALPPASSFS
jgi:hypothetical protein